MWNPRKSASAVKLQPDFANVNIEQIIEDEFWTKKETSCDVELDTNGESNEHMRISSH